MPKPPDATAAGSAGLIEREAELRAVAELLAAAAGRRGGLLLVEGHAGTGKSALLEAAVARGRAAGMTVLRARAGELESGFGFGIALQLFEPLLASADDDARDRLLAGSAALAGPLLERPTSWSGGEAEGGAYQVMHGLFWLLSNLADGGPVLLVVDDVHWADRPSLRLVLYLLQRLEEMAVGIVAARRLGEPGAPDDLLGQIAGHPAVRRVRPAALTAAGARRLVADALPDADEPFVEACRRMTEGNPFLLGELVGAVASEGWAPTEDNAPRIGTLAPEPVLRAVAVRIMRLSDDAAGVARAVAVLGEEAQLRHVAALTGRDLARVAAAADALAASEILRPVGEGPLGFAHPLLASAVYADVGPGERAALHRRAAEILHDEDVAPERVAAHLLPSPGTGSAWVVEILVAAARRALSQGAPESAVSYLRRALEEPPEPAARSSVLLLLGTGEAAIGLAGAVACLHEAVAAAVDDRARARAKLGLARALAGVGRHAEALRALDEAAAADDPRVAVRARAELGALGALDGSRRAALLRAAVDGAGEPPAAATEGGPPAGAGPERSLLAMRAMHLALAGAPRQQVLESVRRALAGAEHGHEAPIGGSVPFALSTALQGADELAWSDRLLTAALDRARARGAMSTHALVSLCRAATRWAQGRLSEALADAESALEAERSGWRQLLPAAYGVTIGLLVDTGDPEAASALAARHDPSAHAGLATLAPWHEALGRLALVERRERAALGHFEAWRDVVTGIDNPVCFAAWRSASAYALASLGRAEEARALAAEELALARAAGAPRAISGALRALAHVESHGALDGPLARLEEAVALTAGGEAVLEHCRAQLDLGTTLRRAGRRTDAGRALGEALELARACGARALHERAAEELEVAGARVRRAARRGADALSPSERRVVALACEGLTNRQIAEALFVTRKAVEWHLGNAYRKLGVRSRHELATALGDTPTG